MRELLLKALELPQAERYRLAFLIAESLGYTLRNNIEAIEVTEYERGWNNCRDLSVAVAELRLQSQSVLMNVLPAVDEITGEDTATQHEWFCKGRESAAAKIARDIRGLKPEPGQ